MNAIREQMSEAVFIAVVKFALFVTIYKILVIEMCMSLFMRIRMGQGQM